MKTYSIQLKYFSALTGWRFCVMNDDEMVNHYATLSEALHCKTQLERAHHQPSDVLSDEVVVVREGYNHAHLLRVREAMGIRS